MGLATTIRRHFSVLSMLAKCLALRMAILPSFTAMFVYRIYRAALSAMLIALLLGVGHHAVGQSPAGDAVSRLAGVNSLPPQVSPLRLTSADAPIHRRNQRNPPPRVYIPGLIPATSRLFRLGPGGPEGDRFGFVGPRGDALGRRPHEALSYAASHLLVSAFSLRQADSNDPGRHIGRGQPLSGTSWLNRPVHADWFIGAMVPDSLIAGRVNQEGGIIGGYRFGRDFDHYWGWEFRFAFSYPELTSPGGTGLSGNSRDLFYDFNTLYYPWGDSRWRPYFTWGLGVAKFDFTDELGARNFETLFSMPFGFGVKWQCRHWLTLRFDALDNLSFAGGGLDTMHNLSFTLGVEVRFGGRRPRYVY